MSLADDQLPCEVVNFLTSGVLKQFQRDSNALFNIPSLQRKQRSMISAHSENINIIRK